MSKRREDKEPRTGARGGEKESARSWRYMRIGETRMEIQATLARVVHDLLSGRIMAAEANRITHTASVQLYLLGLMERLERMMKKEVKKSGGRGVGKGRAAWVN